MLDMLQLLKTWKNGWKKCPNFYIFEFGKKVGKEIHIFWFHGNLKVEKKSCKICKKWWSMTLSAQLELWWLCHWLGEGVLWFNRLDMLWRASKSTWVVHRGVDTHWRREQWSVEFRFWIFQWSRVIRNPPAPPPSRGWGALAIWGRAMAFSFSGGLSVNTVGDVEWLILSVNGGLAPLQWRFDGDEVDCK